MPWQAGRVRPEDPARDRTGDIDVYLGLDVGKGEHHATALTPVGKKTRATEAACCAA
ncbi:hypothetical protein [Streptomyces bungoensis]|uniref:hypothetical protein n=1 Tax=Streptomyces bungoensis TaxID=285568 RepID=UPI000A82623D|nr:hypothetical protein [Streptomyces bungoensis]